MSTNPSPPILQPLATTTPSPSLSLHTYHCLCATLLLCTPYSIPHLPTRASPSRDKARILPLPPIQKRRPSPPPPPPPPLFSKTKEHTATEANAAEEEEQDDDNENENENEEEGGEGDGDEDREEEDGDGDRDGVREREYLPSLILPALRPARKIILVRREDGWERRRVWRCGRCGLGVGYEVEEEGGGGLGGEGKGERLRVMFLLEGGLVETGDWDKDEDGDGAGGVTKRGAVEGTVQGGS